MDFSRMMFIDFVEEAATFKELWNAADALFVSDDSKDDPEWQDAFNLTLAAGYMLRVKVEGWKLFCKRERFFTEANAFASWKSLPGFDRLKQAVDFADTATYTSTDEFIRWHHVYADKHNIRKWAEAPTAESFADTLALTFQDLVKWWGK